MADSNINIRPPWGCNICFEEPRDPVCTTCGHLFCWPCLYTWIQGAADKSCPVCRSHRLHSNASIIPVYVTTPGEPSKPPAATAAPGIPPRPRPLPPRDQVSTTWAALQASRENRRQHWRHEAIRHARRAGPEEGMAELQRLVDVEARGLATLRRELNVHTRRNFYAVDTVMSGSQASTRNARTSSADCSAPVWSPGDFHSGAVRTNLVDHQIFDADHLRRVFATVRGRPSL